MKFVRIHFRFPFLVALRNEDEFSLVDIASSHQCKVPNSLILYYKPMTKSAFFKCVVSSLFSDGTFAYWTPAPCRLDGALELQLHMSATWVRQWHFAAFKLTKVYQFPADVNDFYVMVSTWTSKMLIHSLMRFTQGEWGWQYLIEPTFAMCNKVSGNTCTTVTLTYTIMIITRRLV